MITMKRYIIIVAALMTALSAGAQTTDATIKKVKETYTLDADGSISYNYSKVMTYNTHYSFFSLFGETFVVYNPEYQDLTINHCYTIQKDGTRIDAPENAFNKVLPRPVADAPAYNHITEMVITHTGLELGATVYLDYTIHTKPGMMGSLDIDRTLSQPGTDIKEYTVNINIPEGKNLDWKLSGSKVKPVVNEGSYTWIFRNLPVGAGEAYTAVNGEGLPRLTATTSESLESSLVPFTMETRDLCKVPAEIVNGIVDAGQKAEAIQKFVVNGLGNSGLLPEWTGYRFRQCGEVLRTAYGTVLEKALAMARLMRAEGLEAEVVLVFPANAVKSLKTIKDYLVRCDGTYYSVTTPQKVDPALRADRDEYYDISGKKIGITAKVMDIRCETTADIFVQDGTIYIKTSEGIEEPLKTYGGYAVYTIPSGNGVDAWKMNLLHQKRREMCEIPYAIDEVETVQIQTEDIQWEGNPAVQSIDNVAGKVLVSISSDGKTINVNRHIRLNKSLYTPSEYPALRELLLAWDNRNFRKLIFSPASLQYKK